MTREEWQRYIRDTYSVDGEFLWAKYPGYEIFRHPDNRKWFALIA